MKIYAEFERQDDAEKVARELPFMTVVKVNDSGPKELRDKFIIIRRDDYDCYLDEQITVH